MHALSLFLLCLCVGVVVSLPKLKPKVKSVYFNHTTCPDITNPMWTMIMEGKGIQDGKYHMSYTIILTEDAPKIVKMKITVQKCNLKNVNSCTNFMTVNRDNMCETMKEYQDDPHFQALEPKPSCPIKKGTYVAKDVATDMSKAAYFPGVDKFIWKMRNEMIDSETGKLLGCGLSINRILLE